MAEVERTREFLPNDIIEPSLTDRRQRVNERIEELAANKKNFDTEKQFVGIRRLGPKYTIAEPFAYFDSPSVDKLKFEKYTIMGLTFSITTFGTALTLRTRNYPYFIATGRGMLLSIPLAFIIGKIFDYRRMISLKQHNNFLSYALLHENDFPVYGKFFPIFKFKKLIFFKFLSIEQLERKKYDHILHEFEAVRSLNLPKTANDFFKE